MRYFINAARRLVRTVAAYESVRHIDMDVWKEVNEAEYEKFRRDTKGFTAQQLKKLRAPAST